MNCATTNAFLPNCDSDRYTIIGLGKPSHKNIYH